MIAPVPFSLGNTLATYWHPSAPRASPKSTVATPFSCVSAMSYSVNFSSWLSAKTSVLLRKPAWWMDAPWLKVWMTTSSSSAIRVSQTFTRPSVEPERMMAGSPGWNLIWGFGSQGACLIRYHDREFGCSPLLCRRCGPRYIVSSGPESPGCPCEKGSGISPTARATGRAACVLTILISTPDDP